MTEYVGIEEAVGLLNKIRWGNGLPGFGNSWRYWLRKRSKSNNTIIIGDVKTPFFVIGRKICVDKQQFLDTATTLTKKTKEAIDRKANGPIEEKGTMRGNFVEIIADDKGADYAYFVCCKCEKTAATRNEKEECHRCRDWSPCGKNCTLSHIVCENCNIIQEA